MILSSPPAEGIFFSFASVRKGEGPCGGALLLEQMAQGDQMKEDMLRTPAS